LRRAVRGTDILDLKIADTPLRPIDPQENTLTEQFPELFPLQVAVLVTKDGTGEFGVVHALKEMGIPFFITHDFQQAIRHHLILISPWIDSSSFTEQQAQVLERFVQSGGVVYAHNVFWGVLKPLFGFHDFVASRRRHWVTFAGGQTPIFKYLDRPEERHVRLGSLKEEAIFTTNGYESDGTSEVLARFDDGSAALLAKAVGQG
jgi:hypothetical protein